MARNVNKVFLLGNVTKKPELNHTRNGTAVTNFGLATNENYKDANGEWQERPQFHDITAWGTQAELICKMVDKGQGMFIEGSLNYGSYDRELDSGETVKINTTEITLREFSLTGRPGNGPQEAAAEGPVADDGEFEPDDDLPF